ncbi:SusD/RagB family nutrient-binding outer membrane lipoprotein [Daejeonella sp.]|uniref:SusD/RagB family nutrient-binding outer membrane lipoprotein n=1 Tax=Daejeonella sp. TaxID=2805397 RepID=UPI002C4F30C2|nr:SusD/RagB family nutrient-binding outer membrane lipoprotein [Daejeonella sp.]HQS05631.1 SusD/RagB family nutrient-binding outer membrane lipoprotein [Daejeonella sp.]HQT23126.1 SusD/RagB family nutrient-binding outer membrane lipoprotein [Daejeonella sp.]HQT56037.1 SusD/RagB family nutrient-binding outer membrane lipoprotein [Daejeonella sp.]
MKKFRLYIIASSLVLVTAIGISSCTDKFEEYNTDTSRLTELDASAVGNAFASSQYNGVMFSWQLFNSLFGDLQAQYFGNIAQNFPSDRNVMVGNWLNGAFNGFYNNATRPLLGVMENTAPGGKAANPAIYAIANIWKVRMYQPMTDYWGPIPYSAVGNGLKTVDYDAQDVIYKDFLVQLTKATADLQAFKGKNVLSTNDLIYAGDVDKWIRFANTLRLRIAIRISGVEPALAKTNAEAAVAGGVMETNAHDAYVKTTANNINRMNQATAWNEFRMSAAMESVLTGYADPRLPIYYAPISGTTATFKGIRNGYTQVELGLPANENTKLSNVADRFLPANQNTNPFEVMMAAEAWFLRAEGALKGWNMGSGTAKSFYEKGIETSMKQWGIADAAAIAAYTASTKTPVAVTGAVVSPALTDLPVVWTTDATRQLEQIHTQKWIALWPNGVEAWAEYRRTGFPKLYPRMNSESLFVAKDQVVRRVPYTIGESQTNPAGVATGVAKLGGADNEATRLWWNK